MPGAAQAGFGLVPGATTVSAENRDGTIATQAGSHPYTFTVHFELKTEAGGQSEGGTMRDALTDLPPGLFGNPTAVPACPHQSFEGALPQCAPSTQVGVLHAILPGVGEANGPLYNLIPPPGVAAQLGFSNLGFTALLSASLRSETDYGVHIAAPNLPIEATSVTATIWGAPADPGHTPERGPFGGIASDAPLLPFLTLPTSCQSPPLTSVEVDSKLNPGVFVGGDELVPMRDKGGNPLALSGCEAVPFSPKILAGPSSAQAESAAGLGFQLKLPNQGLLNPKEGAVAETEPVKTEVTLPVGISANPAAVNGQGVCTPAQYKAASATEAGCPQSSKVGTLLAQTPLLEEAIEGSVYLAAPHDNPFDSLLALYVIAQVPQRGVVIKQAGEVQPDPTTGQLTTIIDGLPPIPYSGFEVRLREGPRAPLVTPATCGVYTTTARLYPFSDPTTATVRTTPFTISSGANNGACAQSESELPNNPTLLAGSTVPIAGAFSPFLFKLSREDGEQRFGSVEATLPPGLTARLAGIPACSDAAIAAATARSNEGEGAAEVASPSCPDASQVGTVVAGAGAGPSPYYVQGKAYLAGPYKGAPVSVAFITPAIAGPFDLGTVVIRGAIYIDEETAKVTVKSDPLPTILHGLPLDVRSAAVRMDREGFTLNPTSCEAEQVSATETSTTGAIATLANRFQVGSCQGLSFKPRLSLRFKGKTSRGSHPGVIATLTAAPGEASTAFAQVKLPKAAFLDNAHFKTICTRVQFAEGNGNGERCPAGSVYGSAEATTPLLGYPLAGTVFLRSNPAHTLPDLVVAFKGPDSQPIKFALAGKNDSVKGALRNTFEAAPDVPVSTFRLELFGGKRSLIELSDGLCAHPRATVKLRAHNGAVYDATPKVKASCAKQGRRHRGKW